MKEEGGRHFYWFDWLRFGAALMVVLYHARVNHWVDWSSLPAVDRSPAMAVFLAGIRQGHPAVILFFVLSGFLIGGGLWRRCLEGRFQLMDYTVSRFTRIYLPLIPAIALTVAVNYFVKAQPPAGYFREIAGNIASLQGILCEPLRGDGALWSLSYEVWFYILGGALAALTVPGIRSRTLPLGGALLVFLAGLGIFSILDASLLFCWVLGAVASILSQRLRSRVFVVIGCVLTPIGCGLVAMNNPSGHPVSLVVQSLASLLVAAGMSLVLPSLAFDAPRKKWVGALESFGKWPASFSYTLYLIHIPVLAVLSKWQGAPFSSITMPSFVVFALKVVACLVVAQLVYFLFEGRTAAVRQMLLGLVGKKPSS